MPYTHGLPVWFHIPAASVPRAQAFYSALLNFQFRTGEQAEKEEEDLVHFTYPHAYLSNDLQIGGGIKKIREGEKIVENTYSKETGQIVPTMYFYVDDLDGTMDKVEGLGGKVLTGKVKDGEYGKHVVLRDTEGNAVGVYGC